MGPSLVAWGLFTFLVLSTSSAAATTVDFHPGDGRFSTDRLVINGDSKPNQIKVDYEADSDSFLISDAAERVTSSVCDSLAPHKVRCDNDSYKISVKTEVGSDRILFAGTYGGFDQVRLDGGAGDDRLAAGPGEQELVGGTGSDLETGGAGDDDLSGDAGADRLRGGSGDDQLGGALSEDGADRFFGGPGGDEIEANQDDGADRTINCGPGRGDVAFVEKIDPEPVGCERVRSIGRVGQ